MADRLSLTNEHWLTVRKLAAIDIALLGPRFILAEYALGVVGCGALGCSCSTQPPRRSLVR